MQKRFKGLGVWVAMLVVAYLIYMFAVGFGASQTKMVYSDLVNSACVGKYRNGDTYKR